jgi:hypothetical protein
MSAQIAFGLIDQVSKDEAQELIDALRSSGADAVIAEPHEGKGFVEGGVIVTLVAVSTTSAAVFAVISGFLYRVFRRGVVLDLKSMTPVITKSSDLPRGTLLVLYADGRQEVHESIDGARVGDLMDAALSRSSSGQSPTE